MQILQLKCLNEKCQLIVKDEWEKTEIAKNQLNNKRQSHQERFNSSWVTDDINNESLRVLGRITDNNHSIYFNAKNN